MENQPLVSIVTTFYNSVKLGDFVNRAMNCLLNQTYEKIEFICVNDGSQDETLEQLKEYALKDKRIVIVDKKNEGVAQYAKAAGQEKASGDWIMLFDHDDLISNDAIEKAVKTALRHPELEAVSMLIELKFSDGRIRSYQNLDISSQVKLNYQFRKLSGEEVYKKTVGRYDVHFRGIICKDKFKAFGFNYPEKLVNGDEIVERLIFKNVKYMGNCEGVYEHFIYHNSSAKSYSLKKIDIVRTDVILRKQFQNDNVYEYRKDIFELDAFRSLITGVKIFNHLKNTVDTTTQNLYLNYLKDGYLKLDKGNLINQFKGTSKIYNALILSSFWGMMAFYKLKR